MGRPRKRARNQVGAQPNHNDRLLNSNPFSALPDDEGVVPVEKREKIPPLFTTSKDIGLIRTKLGEHQIYPLFKICSVGTKILCSTKEDYMQVGEFLSVNKFEFYTHDIPGSQPFKVVIRGLPTMLSAEIKAELEKHKLKPINVFAIARRNGAGEYMDNLYLVHFERGTTSLAALQTIRALANIVVQWEKYRPKHRDVTQCTNCLGFGHGTKNCHMKARCGRCAGSHNISACEKTQETEPKCANCGANHNGCDRICPKRADFIRIRQQASSRNQKGRRRAPANTEENFPALVPRHVVPVLPPLPLNNRSARPTVPSAQSRLVAAAATPSPPPPGLSGAWANPSSSSTEDSSLYSSEEIMELTMNLYVHLRACRSKEDQIRAATSVVTKFLCKYGP